MHPEITSLQNPKVKQALSLQKSRERKKQGLFLLEGFREFGIAIQSGYHCERVFFDNQTIGAEELLAHGLHEAQLLPVSSAVYTKMAYRESTSGAVAVMRSKTHILNNVKPNKDPLVLVVESIEKPGNLGALLRTADAAGIDAVLVCDPLVDFYNPNVIRSSVGGVFTRQLAACSSAEAIEWLKAHKINILCTHLEAALPYDQCEYTKPTAIVVGSEASGLSKVWPRHSTHNVIIPMRGVVDSMNVSVAAAVVIFEAVRQRNSTGQMA